jgi:threonine dehydratase
LMRTHVSRIIEVSEDEIRAAVRHLYSDTHQVAEGAGAAAFAAIAQEREHVAGRRVAGILSGGNVDRSTFVEILSEADLSAT